MSGLDLTEVLDDMRREGWVVAVHNDYMLEGERHTFWLFTRGNNFVKGEAERDYDAIIEARAKAVALERAEPITKVMADRDRLQAEVNRFHKFAKLIEGGSQ